MRIARYKTAACTLRNGNALVIGGSADIDGTQLFASTELYDTKRGRFRALYGVLALQADRLDRRPPERQRARRRRRDSGRALRRAGQEKFRLVPGRLDHTRLFLTAATLPGGRALLVGGYDKGITPTAATWIYR